MVKSDFSSDRKAYDSLIRKLLILSIELQKLRAVVSNHMLNEATQFGAASRCFMLSIRLSLVSNCKERMSRSPGSSYCSGYANPRRYRLESYELQLFSQKRALQKRTRRRSISECDERDERCEPDEARHLHVCLSRS